MKPYEVIEHTADIGLKIYGKNLEELFSNGASALLNLVTDVEEVKAAADGVSEEPALIALEAENVQELFLSWLREILFRFSARRIVYLGFKFKALSEQALNAFGTYGRFDAAHDEQRYEVKAVTYHQFKLEKSASGWTAEVILDI